MKKYNSGMYEIIRYKYHHKLNNPMNFFVLATLVTACLGDTPSSFRFKNATVKTPKTTFTNVEGSIIVAIDNGDVHTGIAFSGMALDSMTFIFLISQKDYDHKLNIEAEVECRGMLLERNEIDLTGTTKFNGTSDEGRIIGNCFTPDGSLIAYNVTGSKANNFFYTAKEAGLRAKNMVGQDIQRYQPHEVINYAFFDIPYFSGDCSYFLDFPSLSGPAPGAIIVGVDGKHCGIIDNEGTKFVHGNPIKKLVTLDSLVMINTYFPKGVVYRKFPDKIQKIPRQNNILPFIKS